MPASLARLFLAAPLAAGLALVAPAPSARAGTQPFVGEVMFGGFDFCPSGWAPTDGRLLSISQNVSLFALLGTRFGGDGKATFALPRLQNQVAATVTVGGKRTSAPLQACISLFGVFPPR